MAACVLVNIYIRVLLFYMIALFCFCWWRWKKKEYFESITFATPHGIWTAVRVVYYSIQDLGAMAMFHFILARMTRQNKRHRLTTTWRAKEKWTATKISLFSQLTSAIIKQTFFFQANLLFYQTKNRDKIKYLCVCVCLCVCVNVFMKT